MQLTALYITLLTTLKQTREPEQPLVQLLPLKLHLIFSPTETQETK